MNNSIHTDNKTNNQADTSVVNATLDLARDLIKRNSVTPVDAGCQERLSQYLSPLGFVAENMPFGDVSNLWLRRETQAPLVVFAGHTDVVPSGQPEEWSQPPFAANIKDGLLYGRGAADMKSSVAAFAVASREFVQTYPEHKGSIALLITSDEEGNAVNGTVKVCQALQARGEQLDYCIVGEPSSHTQLGDTVKVGRRGSLNGILTVFGKQGHIAYPHMVINPIHLCAPAIAELSNTIWDKGNQYFPATTFQISNFQSGTGANNVVPGSAIITFNFRFSTESTEQSLKHRVQQILDSYGFKYQIDWSLSGEPFLTPAGNLSDALNQAIEEITGISPEPSTSGGTSDGRFIAKICPQIVEFGPISASIHQVDEHIKISDLEPLKNIYKRMLELLLLD